MSDDARAGAEYVPLNEWPAEAWEPLLERFFDQTIETDEHRYVLLRIPADEFDRLAQQHAGGSCLQRVGTGGGLCKRPAGHSGDHDD